MQVDVVALLSGDIDTLSRRGRCERIGITKTKAERLCGLLTRCADARATLSSDWPLEVSARRDALSNPMQYSFAALLGGYLEDITAVLIGSCVEALDAAMFQLAL